MTCFFSLQSALFVFAVRAFPLKFFFFFFACGAAALQGWNLYGQVLGMDAQFIV
jgi:hypothetical protein